MSFIKSDKKEGSFEISINNRYYLLLLKKEKNRLYGLLINIDEIRKKDEMLIAQSRLAQMGEMVNMIAHQWRQPINAISASLIRLELMLENICEEEDFKYTKEIIEFINNLIQDLSNTIEEFLNFSKPVSKYKKLTLKEVVYDVLKIIETQLKNHNIKVITDIQNAKFSSYKKEIEHILLNLIVNARNILDERKKRIKKSQ